MRNLVIILLAVFALNSCSEYQEALKSEDMAAKYKMAEDLYNEGKFGKANRLFAQVLQAYAGKPQGQRVRYMFAKSFYELRDYTLAAYQFQRFVESYPDSEKAEESAFLAAKSYYELSPIFSKSQDETKEAIEKLQLFINRFPESEYISQANELVSELDTKLERKAYEIAYLYNKTAYYDSSDYEAAIKSFDNFLLDYPGSIFRERAMFYRFDSAYKLAVNSVQYKKEERLIRAKEFYDTLIKYYPESEYLELAEEMKQVLDTELATFNTQS